MVFIDKHKEFEFLEEVICSCERNIFKIINIPDVKVNISSSKKTPKEMSLQNKRFNLISGEINKTIKLKDLLCS